MKGRKQEATRAESGDLLDVLALDESGVIVTTEGALVRIAEVTPRNPRVMGDDERRRVSEGFGAMVGRLSDGQSLQFYVEAAPVRLPEVLAQKREIVEGELKRQPWQRADALRELAAAHEQSLTAHASDRAAVRFRAYVIVPFVKTEQTARIDWQALRPGGRRLPRGPLTRPLAAHQRAVQASLKHTDDILADLAGLDMSTRLLEGLEVAELLYRRFNPSAAGSGYVPRRLEVLGSLDELANARAAAEAAHVLREQVAASPVDFADSRFVGVEQDLERVHYVSSVADVTEFGWLLDAMEIDRPFALSVFVHALDRRKERGRARRTRTRLHGVNEGVRAKRRIPNETMAAKEDEAGELLEELRGSQRASLYDVSIYQTVREPGPMPDLGRLVEASDGAVARLRDAVDCDARFGGFMQHDLWQSTLPLGRDVARRTKKYVTRNVGDTVPLVGPGCGSPTGIPFFFAEGVRTLENLDPWDDLITNSLMLINGLQGSGKTMTAITMAARLLPYGVNVTVLDRSEHWKMLTMLVPGAAHLSIGAADSDVTINPWDVPDPGRVSREKVTFLRDLHELLIGERGASERGEITEEERNLLSLGIRGVYASCAREGGRAARERDLVTELDRLRLEDLGAANGSITHRATVLRSLADRLGRYVGDGEDAYLVDRMTTVPADSPLTVLDMRRARSQMPAAMFIALERLQNEVERRKALRQEMVPRPYFPGDALFSDETWALMKHRVTGEFFNDLSRRSRHLGLFNVAVTQHLSDFDNEFGLALLQSAHRKLFLEQSVQELEGLRKTLGLSDNELRVISRLSTVKGRYSRAYWINGVRGRGEVSVLLGSLEYWLATSEPNVDVPKRNAALARHPGDPWAALRELAEGGTGR
jgi:hypothetical protein